MDSTHIPTSLFEFGRGRPPLLLVLLQELGLDRLVHAELTVKDDSDDGDDGNDDAMMVDSRDSRW